MPPEPHEDLMFVCYDSKGKKSIYCDGKTEWWIIYESGFDYCDTVKLFSKDKAREIWENDIARELGNGREVVIEDNVKCDCGFLEKKGCNLMFKDRDAPFPPTCQLFNIDNIMPWIKNYKFSEELYRLLHGNRDVNTWKIPHKFYETRMI